MEKIYVAPHNNTTKMNKIEKRRRIKITKLVVVVVGKLYWYHTTKREFIFAKMRAEYERRRRRKRRKEKRNQNVKNLRCLSVATQHIFIHKRERDTHIAERGEINT
jgi:hypothetical protein